MEWNGKTKQEWYDLINSKTVDQVIQKLIPRIVTEPNYRFDGAASYASLVMQNKPSLAQFEEELVKWKVDSIAEIDEKFVSIELRESFKQRIEALNYPVISASKASGNPNGTMVLKMLLEELNESKMKAIELKDVEVSIEIASLQVDKDQRSDARDRLTTHLEALEGLQSPTPIQQVLKDILIVLGG